MAKGIGTFNVMHGGGCTIRHRERAVRLGA
jgi:hypothetical protein